MASSGESDARDRSGKTDPPPKEHDDQGTPPAGPPEREGPSPFAEDDPYRAGRVNAVLEQTGDTVSYLSQDELREMDQQQAETLSRDAEQRREWPEPVADAYQGLLRVASRRTPPRKNRVL